MTNDAGDQPTPGPGWWVDDDGELRPPTATTPSTEPPPSRPPSTAPSTAVAATAMAPPTTATWPGEPLASGFDGAGHLGGAGDGERPGAPPPADLLGPAPTGGAIGASFTWACRALWRNLPRLGVVSVLVIAVWAVVVFVLVVLGAAAGEMNIASATVALGLVGAAVVVAGGALTWLLLARAWYDVARGDELRLELVDPTQLGAAAVVTVALVPFTIVLPVLGAFVTMAFLLVVETSSPGSAIGRMLSETMASARRFFHTVVIGVVAAVWSLVIVVAWSWLSILIGASVGSSAFEDAFVGNDNVLRDVDQDATAWLGLGVGGLVLVVAALVMGHLIGLWSAGLLRRFTGRAMGRAGADPEGVAP